MKICVIGAGWVGCHLTKKLKENHRVDLYDVNGVFSKTSFLNQNRLHLGYHYSRSFDTRNMCRDTFSKFLNEYGFLTDDIFQNVYAISASNSILDYKTYLKIFDDYETHHETNFDYLTNIEGAIVVDEKYINPEKSKNYFCKILKENIINKEIFPYEIEKLKKKYDLVINCTNNSLDPIIKNVYSEVCHLLLYKRKKKTPFEALTLVDGKLFSIYPYDKEEIFSLTDVEMTPRSDVKIEEKRKYMEEKVLNYYNDFLKDFEYVSFRESKKIKYFNMSDNRVPLIEQEENYIKTFTGKIQGIFLIEDYLKNI